MKLLAIFLFLSTLLGLAEPVNTKAKELVEAKNLVGLLKSSRRASNRPSLGIQSYWDFHINTYAHIYSHQLEPSEIHELYYDACRKIEELYKADAVTYLKKDEIGWPVQTTLVNFKDRDFGESYLVAVVWQGNDSQQFYFAHMPGSYNLPKGSKRRDTWSLEGIVSGAKKPAEQDGADQPATASEPKPEGKEKTKPQSKVCPQ